MTPRCQNAIDKAALLNQILPVDIGNVTHAGDGIADRDIGRTLPPVHFTNHRIGRRTLCCQAAVEPLQSGRDAGILIAQPVH